MKFSFLKFSFLLLAVSFSSCTLDDIPDTSEVFLENKPESIQKDEIRQFEKYSFENVTHEDSKSLRMTCDCTPDVLVEYIFDLEAGDACPTIKVTLLGLLGEDCTCDVASYTIVLQRDISFPGIIPIGSFVTSVPNGFQSFVLQGLGNLPGISQGFAFINPFIIDTATELAVGESVSFSYQTDHDEANIITRVFLDCEDGLVCPFVDDVQQIDITCI